MNSRKTKRACVRICVLDLFRGHRVPSLRSGFQKKNPTWLHSLIVMANILIVEDEPRMRRLLEISLGEDGHNAQTVEDAETGLKFLRKETADLVVTDLKLPGMNGLEFLQE